jgi:hypothetical protein
MHLGLAGRLAIPDARQKIGDGIGHTHAVFLTSSP